MEPTKPPIQWVPGALHTGENQANHVHLCNTTVNNGSNHTSTSPYVHRAMLNYACRKFKLWDQCPDICAQWPTFLPMLCDCLKPGGNYMRSGTFSTKNSAFIYKFIYAFLLTHDKQLLFEYNANMLHFQIGRAWLRRSVADFSLRRPRFDVRTVHVGFVADKDEPEQISLRGYRISSIMIYIRSHFHGE